MRIIPIEEIREFVLNQPDDKIVDLMDAAAGAKNGCILCHYAKANDIRFDFCGFSFIQKYGEIGIMISKNILTMFNGTFSNSHFKGTYGELKKLMSN